MQELSLNILDIAQNSLRAGATFIEIMICKNTDSRLLTVSVSDDGCGMNEEQLAKAVSPFYSTRSSHNAGFGIPFFKMSAEMTGGHLEIRSMPGQGTVVTACYCYEHVDMLPLGDFPSVAVSLISGCPDTDFSFEFSVDDRSFSLDTREAKEILKEVPITSPEAISFFRSMLTENIREIGI